MHACVPFSFFLQLTWIGETVDKALKERKKKWVGASVKGGNNHRVLLFVGLDVGFL